jgi:hypothetical protein
MDNPSLAGYWSRHAKPLRSLFDIVYDLHIELLTNLKFLHANLSCSCILSKSTKGRSLASITEFSR